MGFKALLNYKTTKPVQFTSKFNPDTKRPEDRERYPANMFVDTGELLTVLNCAILPKHHRHARSYHRIKQWMLVCIKIITLECALEAGYTYQDTSQYYFCNVFLHENTTEPVTPGVIIV